MLDVYQTLEFNKIQEQILEFAKTERGKEKILSLKMSSDKDEIIRELSKLDEMMNLIRRFSPLPLTGSVHIIKLIELAKKTALLTPSDLNFILNDIETSEKIIAHFKKTTNSFPLLELKSML